eukprot:1807041-Prymnesium_polylepis.1
MTGSPPAVQPPARWSKDTPLKSNERLEIGRFLIRITNHSFRGLITATLPRSTGRGAACTPARAAT